MTTMLNVYEAKSNFSSVLAEVENKLSIFTIMRCRRIDATARRGKKEVS